MDYHKASECTEGIHSHRGTVDDWCPQFREHDRQRQRTSWVNRQESDIKWNKTRRAKALRRLGQHLIDGRVSPEVAEMLLEAVDERAEYS